mmetsp:Transcript_9452/g.14254  ORF Transcript_9452/g.14254 Transcript_9452/m.14254 type:complete len:250 (-) Transcript_9452:176-925(-)
MPPSYPPLPYPLLLPASLAASTNAALPLLHLLSSKPASLAASESKRERERERNFQNQHICVGQKSHDTIHGRYSQPPHPSKTNAAKHNPHIFPCSHSHSLSLSLILSIIIHLLLGPLQIILLNLRLPHQLQIPLPIPIARLLDLPIPQLGQRRQRSTQFAHPRWILLAFQYDGSFRFGWILLIFGIDGFEAGDGYARWHCGEGGCGGVVMMMMMILVVVGGGGRDGGRDDDGGGTMEWRSMEETLDDGS